MVAKKAAKKIAKKVEQIKAQKVGKNLIIVIDNKKLVKKDITDKEEVSIKNKILLFNKKPNETLKKSIINLVDKTIEVKAKKEALKKGLKKSIKKQPKAKKEVKRTIDTLINKIKTSEIKRDNLTPDEISNLAAFFKALLEKAKKIEEKIEEKAITTQQPRKGEY